MSGDVKFEKKGTEGVTCSRSCLGETVGVGKRVNFSGRFVCADLGSFSKDGGDSRSLDNARTCLMSLDATENKE